MASGKLDQSLDEIMKDGGSRGRGRGGRRNNPRRAATGTKTKAAAPAGGIAKSTKPAKKTAAAAPAINAAISGESKIIVSGLPEDVDEVQIKDYFTQTIGPVKKAMLTYGPSGRSRGVATIIFVQPGSAAKAAATLNGVKVDNRAMKIEVVVGAKNISSVPAKGLSDRIASQPKNAAKEKSKGKPVNGKAAVTNGAAKTAQGAKKKSGRAGRPKRKTAEELDAEMKDYFGGDANGTAATVVQATTNGAAAPDTSMVS